MEVGLHRLLSNCKAAGCRCTRWQALRVAHCLCYGPRARHPASSRLLIFFWCARLAGRPTCQTGGAGSWHRRRQSRRTRPGTAPWSAKREKQNETRRRTQHLGLQRNNGTRGGKQQQLSAQGWGEHAMAGGSSRATGKKARAMRLCGGPGAARWCAGIRVAAASAGRLHELARHSSLAPGLPGRRGGQGKAARAARGRPSAGMCATQRRKQAWAGSAPWARSLRLAPHQQSHRPHASAGRACWQSACRAQAGRRAAAGCHH